MGYGWCRGGLPGIVKRLIEFGERLLSGQRWAAGKFATPVHILLQQRRFALEDYAPQRQLENGSRVGFGVRDLKPPTVRPHPSKIFVDVGEVFGRHLDPADV